MDWFDRAVEELERALDNGEITQKEFDSQMRDLRSELRASAEEAADNAYKDAMGEW